MKRERPDAAQRADIAQLFADHNSALVRFLRLRLNSDQEAHEVAQEAYVRLLRLDQPGAVSFLRAYLFKTAANLATDRLRGQVVRRIAHSDPIFESTPDDLDPERAALAREQLALLEQGVNELPEHVRTAFLLHRLHGLSVVEVARRMGVSERTARNYVVRAMLHCRSKLDGDTPPDIQKEFPP